MFRKISIGVASFFGALILFLLASVLPIERYDYKTKSFYQVMMKRLDQKQSKPKGEAKGNFSVGYAKVNLTPSHSIALAGYGDRKGAHYTSVHDSVFVRTMVVTRGTERVAIVAVDLLIVPPSVTLLLQQELPSIGFSLNNTYLSATHSHNSFGNWSEGVVRVIYGKYDDVIVHSITDKIKKSILLALHNSKPATIKTAHIPLREPLRNRINDHGSVDSLLHVVEVKQSDSSKMILVSYTAHATCLQSDDLALSRDYPGKLVDELESRGYNFAMFLAGAVGSHAGAPPEGSWPCVDWMAKAIVDKFENNKALLTPLYDSTLTMVRIPLELGKAQVKVLKDWKMRPWLFHEALGESPNYLTGLRIGELVMLGTPCDYSGELTPHLYSYARKKNLQAMVTSFNGGYIGYITPVRYYDVDHYETRLMNWYGPGSGEYMEECLDKMVDLVAD